MSGAHLLPRSSPPRLVLVPALCPAPFSCLVSSPAPVIPALCSFFVWSVVKCVRLGLAHALVLECWVVLRSQFMCAACAAPMEVLLAHRGLWLWYLF